MIHGPYGFYIIGSYVLALAVLAWNVWVPISRRRALQRGLAEGEETDSMDEGE